jgi:hypothetical protein
VAFVYPGDRLAEYANSAAHARYLTAELLPRLEAEFPLAGTPSGRCLMGASFGAVAALSTAYRYPEVYGSLLLQSGSFVFTDIGHDHGGGPAVRAGGEVRQPVPRGAAAGSPTGCSSAAGLRAADHPQPVDGPGVRGRRDGRPLRRGPRRAQLGELARPAREGCHGYSLVRRSSSTSDAMKTVERWYSDRLQQEITVVRWGRSARPVLVFPSAGGDAEEIERQRPGRRVRAAARRGPGQAVLGGQRRRAGDGDQGGLAGAPAVAAQPVPRVRPAGGRAGHPRRSRRPGDGRDRRGRLDRGVQRGGHAVPVPRRLLARPSA